jgi:prepilin peptidase CpaA
MDTADFITFACVFVFTAVGLACDVMKRKLPNVLTVPAFFAALLFHAVHGFMIGGLSGLGGELLFSFKGFAFGFVVILALWFIGGSGGGDVKFTAALGAWLGTWRTFQVLTLSAMLAGALTLILLGDKVFLLKRTKTANHKPRRDGKKPAKEPWRVPFGLPAALATWILILVELAGKGLPSPM